MASHQKQPHPQQHQRIALMPLLRWLIAAACVVVIVSGLRAAAAVANTAAARAAHRADDSAGAAMVDQATRFAAGRHCADRRRAAGRFGKRDSVCRDIRRAYGAPATDLRSQVGSASRRSVRTNGSAWHRNVGLHLRGHTRPETHSRFRVPNGRDYRSRAERCTVSSCCSSPSPCQCSAATKARTKNVAIANA